MNIEQKEPPSLADSAKRIVNSIGKLAETSVKSAKLLKQLQGELEKKERIISKQASEIAHLRQTLDRSLIQLDKYEMMLGESPC